MYKTNIREQIVSASKEKPFYTARRIRDALQQSNPQLRYPSVSTVKKILQKSGLPGFRANTKQNLSENHMTARLKFAEEHKFFDWKKVVYSDEKTIQNYYNG